MKPVHALAIMLCATSLNGLADTADEMRSRAKNDTIDTLCMVQILRPEVAQIARDELAMRKAKCDWARTKLQTDAYIQQQQYQQVAKQQENETARQKADVEQRHAAAEHEAALLEGQRASEAFDRQRQLDAIQQQSLRQDQEAKEAAAARDRQAIVQAIQNRGPYLLQPIQSPPKQTNCRTIYYGGGAQTTCQ